MIASGGRVDHIQSLSRSSPMPLAPIAAVDYLEAAPAFASNYGLGMALAQLDLTNRWLDLNGCWRRVEVSLEHCLGSITIHALGSFASLSSGLFQLARPATILGHIGSRKVVATRWYY